MTAAETPPAKQPWDWRALVAEHLPNMAALVTEHRALLSNLFRAKQQRLLVESLYSSWAGPGEGSPFLIEANMGVFYSVHRPPLVPDVMLSVDAQWPDDVWTKTKHAYCIWDYGKLPEVVIDIITDQHSPKGEHKFHDYAWVGIPFCIVVDPTGQLGAEPLRVYIRDGRKYDRLTDGWFASLGLGVTLWQGVYEGLGRTWLRWCDQAGNVLPTGAERAAAAEQRTTQAHQRAERLAAQLQALGVEPQEAS